jgi:hypothetical protein
MDQLSAVAVLMVGGYCGKEDGHNSTSGAGSGQDRLGWADVGVASGDADSKGYVQGTR